MTSNDACGFPSLPPFTPSPGRDHVPCHRTGLPAPGGDIAGAVPALLPTAGAYGLAAEPPRLPFRAVLNISPHTVESSTSHSG